MDNLALTGHAESAPEQLPLERVPLEQMPPVSVVIPSYRDADLLRCCLEALGRQTYPSDKVEIIVVDNAGDEAVRQVCQEFGVTYMIEMRPGVAAARNHGIVKASHEVLAFTDSDVIPLADWLERGVRRFCATENCGFVAGAVEIFTQGRPTPSLAEIYEVVMAFPVRMYMEKHGYGVHANMFTSASVLKQVGPLDPNLAGAEDWEWGRRFAGRDLVVTYDDDVRVLHPARRTVAQLVKKSRRATLGYCQWNPEKTKKLRFIIYHFALLGTFKRRCPERMRQFGLRKRSAIYALASYLQWVAAIECSRILLTGRTNYRP